MTKVLRALVLLALVVSIVAPIGCSGEDPAKPNPDLKVPDIKPSNRSGPGSGGPTKPKG